MASSRFDGTFSSSLAHYEEGIQETIITLNRELKIPGLLRTEKDI